jgi:hypothetical protein
MDLATAYPNSAISAGAMTAIALVAVGTLAIWLIMVYLADRQRGDKEIPQAASPDGTVPKPRAAAEDEHSEAGRAPAGPRHEAAA